MGSLEIFFRYRPNQRPDIEGLVDTVREVFRANGVNIDVRAGGDAPLVVAGMESVRISGCTMLTGDHEGLFDAIRPRLQSNQVVVFVVRSIVDAGILSGCAACPPDCPGALITEAAAGGGVSGSARSGRWVLAHEIGHLLGLGHVNTTTSLMCDPATSISVAPPRLSAQERVSIEASGLIAASPFPRSNLSLRGFRSSGDGLERRATPERSIDERDTPLFPTRRRSLLDQFEG